MEKMVAPKNWVSRILGATEAAKSEITSSPRVYFILEIV